MTTPDNSNSQESLMLSGEVTVSTLDQLRPRQREEIDDLHRQCFGEPLFQPYHEEARVLFILTTRDKNGKVSGAAALRNFRTFSFATPQSPLDPWRVLTIESVCVRRDQRRQGVARKLIEKAVKVATSQEPARQCSQKLHKLEGISLADWGAKVAAVLPKNSILMIEPRLLHALGPIFLSAAQEADFLPTKESQRVVGTSVARIQYHDGSIYFTFAKPVELPVVHGQPNLLVQENIKASLRFFPDANYDAKKPGSESTPSGQIISRIKDLFDSWQAELGQTNDDSIVLRGTQAHQIVFQKYNELKDFLRYLSINVNSALNDTFVNIREIRSESVLLGDASSLHGQESVQDVANYLDGILAEQAAITSSMSRTHRNPQLLLTAPYLVHRLAVAQQK